MASHLTDKSSFDSSQAESPFHDKCPHHPEISRDVVRTLPQLHYDRVDPPPIAAVTNGMELIAPLSMSGNSLCFGRAQPVSAEAASEQQVEILKLTDTINRDF